jgi:hypothetical protein
VRFEEDALESYRPAALATGDVEDQIRALEARLDGLIQGAARTELAPSPPEPTLAAVPTPELDIER